MPLFVHFVQPNIVHRNVAIAPLSNPQVGLSLVVAGHYSLQVVALDYMVQQPVVVLDCKQRKGRQSVQELGCMLRTGRLPVVGLDCMPRTGLQLAVVHRGRNLLFG